MDIIDWIVQISEMIEREREGGESKERGREIEGEGGCIGKSWTFFLNYSCEVEEGVSVCVWKKKKGGGGGRTT